MTYLDRQAIPEWVAEAEARSRARGPIEAAKRDTVEIVRAPISDRKNSLRARLRRRLTG